ncbi:helix-turn-helix domain-containing protein [Rhodococcoides yunnanense]|uniref:helix-turn-helix domain-containing protein n=1 Tax=Rhodococcoides yunnanense TaxID=278209 RepID=UPI0035304099
MTGVRVARTKLQWFTELRGADLTHAEFRVVTILATYTDAQMDNAFPGLNKLATEARVRVNTAREALKSLQSKGWIRLTQEGGNQYGKGRANVWSLTIPGEKGVADRTPSTPLKGVADRTPSSRDGHVTTAPALAISESESEGVRSEHEGVRSEHSEGGRSPHPHQVVTIRAENSSGPSAPVSPNAPIN